MASFAWKGWTTMNLPAKLGIVKPLLAAVPPGKRPRLAACGWLSVPAADAMGVALVVFKGVNTFDDFVAKPDANTVKASSAMAKKLGIMEGMPGADALHLLESAETLEEEKASVLRSEEAAGADTSSVPNFSGWTTAELPVSCGLPKPLLVAVPPGEQPRMAACGWVDLATAEQLDVALAVFKGVAKFSDFVDEAAATSNVVKAVSPAAVKLSVTEGMLGGEALQRLSAL
eukprot:TRINITY_DN25680_c0_g1_i1.p1 TRINITY_DN25680_c0_g1~~TRINITY_DN25680_c0_g1_i1.p1  ORF type:complete len:230 (+),score=43.56 TRINITY_DN25680_c0_g1_i1:49-738(+)